MKKKILGLSIVSLMMLCACGGAETLPSESTTPSTDTGTMPSEPTTPSTGIETSDTEESQDTEKPVEGVVFDTITALSKHMMNQANTLDITYGKSYVRNAVVVEKTMYGQRTTSTQENGESYSNKTLYAAGKEDVSYVDDEFESQNYQTSDTYQILRTLEDDTFYQIVDYNKGKERDQAFRVPYESSLDDQILQATALNSVYYFNYYYDTFLKSHIISGFDDIVPEVDKTTGESHYVINRTWNENYSGTTYDISVKFDVTLTDVGAMKNFSFYYLQQADNDGQNVIISSIQDSFDVTLGTKEEYVEKEMDPKDYFMTDYDIQLLSNDGILEENTKEDHTAFPIGQYVKVEAINVAPDKAVDTKLEIIDSSNPEVIEIKTYGGNVKPSIKAVGVGKTTLTVRSESGIEKTIEVTVVAPAMEKIAVRMYLSHKYKGETENIYVFASPDNTKDTYTVTASENIRLVKDSKGDYSAEFLEVGPAWVKATCNEHPEVTSQLDFTIEEKKSVEEVKNNIQGIWTGALPGSSGGMIENAASVEFTNETDENGKKKGYFTLNSDDTGFTFVVGKKYEFTYEIMESEDPDDDVYVKIGTISYVSEAGFETTYDDNYAYFMLNGKDANIVFSLSDPNYFGFTVDLDATKTVE